VSIERQRAIFMLQLDNITIAAVCPARVADSTLGCREDWCANSVVPQKSTPLCNFLSPVMDAPAKTNQN
jgi:hypothetical protein